LLYSYSLRSALYARNPAPILFIDRLDTVHKARYVVRSEA